MTKERYYEACEAMGTEPSDDELPVEFDELPGEVQQAFSVYKMLKDEWDTMNGVYLGKSYIGIKDIFEMLDIEPINHRLTYQFLMTIDSIRAEELKKKTPKK